MKKLMMAVAIVCAAALSQAATVSWTNMGMAAAKGDAYAMFAVGANGVTSIDFITGLLDAKPSTAWGDIQKYSLGYGTVNASGQAGSATGTIATKELGEGTYTAFMVVFDDATPAPGAKYAVLSGATGYSKTVGASTATVTFAGGSMTSALSGATWKTYGESVPEPTSGLLMLIGMAGLALRRRRA